jgi:pimeloyl-ACP methyl ester carboxylesterase
MRPWIFALVLALCPALVAAAEPVISWQALEAAHAEPGSRFLEVDGVRLHYVDEGPRTPDAPPVVLLNASYLNLSSWQAVAAALKTSHRVIRLDFPTVGLSGPAPDAALDIRAFEGLVTGLMDRLGVRRATLVGTSSGAIVAFRLAAAQPERFARLVLLNAAGLPRTAATDPLRQRVRAPGAPPPGSLDFWRESLTNNFADPARLTEAFVAQVHDLNRRAGQDREGRVFLKTFATGDPQAVLGKVAMPVLILWGEKGITLSHLEAEVFAHWLVRAPRLVRKYKDAGHYPQVEIPQAVAADIAAFMAGTLDAQMLPPAPPVAATLNGLPFWRANAGLWLGEDVYLTAAGERKIDGYANLTETRLSGEMMEEEEYRFYAPSEMATAMAGGLLRPGEGVEVRRLLKGRMADAGGRVVMLPAFNGQGPDKLVTFVALTEGQGLMTVRAPGAALDGYRVHYDLTAPDMRIRNTMGLEPDGALRAIALYREQRQDPATKAARLAALRARFKVAVMVEAGPDGKPVARRPGE